MASIGSYMGSENDCSVSRWSYVKMKLCKDGSVTSVGAVGAG